MMLIIVETAGCFLLVYATQVLQVKKRASLEKEMRQGLEEKAHLKEELQQHKDRGVFNPSLR